MSGSIQSSNYVPGVSGLKIDISTGKLEINSWTFGNAKKAPEHQMVSVEVASYSKYDLPKNAANLLQFMEAELQKVPEQYRRAAEFEEFDASYGDESFNARLFLSYSRLETEEELVDRLAKAKVAGTRINLTSDGMAVTHDGAVRIKIENLEQPFVVEGDQITLSSAEVEAATITNAKISGNWSVNIQQGANGLYAAGIGMGFIVDPARFGATKDGQTETEKVIASGDAGKILDHIAGLISKTDLVAAVKANADQISSSFADQVKDVIRSELRQGGLLWRSR